MCESWSLRRRARVDSDHAGRALRRRGDPRRRLRPRPALPRRRNIGDRPAHSVRNQVRPAVLAASAARRRCTGSRSFAGSSSSRRTSRSRSSSTAARRTSPARSRRSSPPRSRGGHQRRAGDRSTIHHDLEIYRDLGFIEREVPHVAVQRDNPYPNFNFVVEIGVGAELGFSEVELPAGEIEVIEYREGADRVNSARKLPGRVKYANVVLKRGITGQPELFEWWKSVRDGEVQRRNVDDHAARRAAQPVLRVAAPQRVAREDRRSRAQRDRQRGRDRDARARARGPRDRVSGLPAALPAPASRSSGSGCGSRAPRPTAGRGRGCRRSGCPRAPAASVRWRSRSRPASARRPHRLAAPPRSGPPARSRRRPGARRAPSPPSASPEAGR